MKVYQFNGETGEEIVRDMTAEEIAQQKIDLADKKTREQAAAEMMAKKEALLVKLGITDEEAKLLLNA